MYKISVNEKLLSIGKKKIQNSINIPYVNSDTFVQVLDILYNTQIKAVHIYNSDKNKIWKKFQKLAVPVYAAGGLVKNKNGKYLFIKRNGIWDLPKGHIEEKETFKQAAVREVEEECSIHGLIVKKYLMTTYHIYSSKQKYYLKVVQWFKMEYKGNEKPKPQSEEGIEIVGWYSKKTLPKLMKNTFKNIKELINTYILK